MTTILNATLSNGQLVLQKELSPELEGKKLKIIILDADSMYQADQTESEAAAQARINRFIERSKQYSAKLPADYKFDRDELYDR